MDYYELSSYNNNMITRKLETNNLTCRIEMDSSSTVLLFCLNCVWIIFLHLFILLKLSIISHNMTMQED